MTRLGTGKVKKVWQDYAQIKQSKVVILYIYIYIYIWERERDWWIDRTKIDIFVYTCIIVTVS